MLQWPQCVQPTRAPAGSGLGRNKQGIVTPLMHQKTDKRGGVIVSGPDTWNADTKPEDGNPEQKPKVGGVEYALLAVRLRVQKHSTAWRWRRTHWCARDGVWLS